MRYSEYRDRIAEDSVEVDGDHYYSADVVLEVLDEIESNLNAIKDKIEDITVGLY